MTCWLTAGKQKRAYQRLSDGLEITRRALQLWFQRYCRHRKYKWGSWDMCEITNDQARGYKRLKVCWVIWRWVTYTVHTKHSSVILELLGVHMKEATTSNYSSEGNYITEKEPELDNRTSSKSLDKEWFNIPWLILHELYEFAFQTKQEGSADLF